MFPSVWISLGKNWPVETLSKLPLLFPNATFFRFIGIKRQFFFQRDFDSLLGENVVKLNLFNMNVPDDTELVLKSKSIKSLNLFEIHGLKKLRLECENLEKLGTQSIGLSPEQECFPTETVNETILEYLIENPQYSSKLSSINLCSFWSEMYEDTRVPKRIKISEFDFPQLKVLDLLRVFSLVELDIVHHNLREISLSYVSSLKKVSIKSNSLRALHVSCCIKLKSLTLEKCDKLEAVHVDDRVILEKMLIESKSLQRIMLAHSCMDKYLIETLKTCPSIQSLEIGDSDLEICSSLPTNKLIHALPQLSPNLTFLNISPSIVTVSKEALAHLQKCFQENQKQLEIHSKYVIEEKIEEGKEISKSFANKALGRWKNQNLFKFFNSWRTYRNLVATKAFLHGLTNIEERLEMIDLSLYKHAN